jgi:hypothetical protein
MNVTVRIGVLAIADVIFVPLKIYSISEGLLGR